MKNLTIISFLLLLGGYGFGQESMPDSLTVGKYFCFDVSNDSLQQQILIKRLNDSQIYYFLSVKKGKFFVNRLSGKASASGNLHSNSGNEYIFESEVGNLSIRIIGNDAKVVGIYQGPILKKEMNRIKTPNKLPFEIEQK